MSVWVAGKYIALLYAVLIPLHSLAYQIAGSGTPHDSYDNSNPPKAMRYYAWNMNLLVYPTEGNICYQKSNCYLVYGEQLNSNGFSAYRQIPKLASRYQFLWEVLGGESADYYFNGKTFYYFETTIPEGYPCLNLGYQIGSGTPQPIDPQSCKDMGSVPPPPASCQLNAATIVLQHPTLNASELAGHKKEVTANVSCNRAATIKLAINGLNGNSQLSLQGGNTLYSTLHINNAPAATGVTLRNVGSNGAPLTFSSTLGVNGFVPSGQYSASAVLTMTIL
ncbi:TPA: hypothetical protein ACKP8B_002518 [Serratia marcescens]